MAEATSWTCSLCTFNNKMTTLKCLMCDQSRIATITSNDPPPSNNNNNNNISFNNHGNPLCDTMDNDNSIHHIDQRMQDLHPTDPNHSNHINNNINNNNNNNNIPIINNNDNNYLHTNYESNTNYNNHNEFNSNEYTDPPDDNDDNNIDDDIHAMHQDEQEINMLFHQNNNNSNNNINQINNANNTVINNNSFNNNEQHIPSNEHNETLPKWNCLMCTLENKAELEKCEACNGPSVLKNELWGKRICRICNTINNTELNNCQNCHSELREIVDYDDNAKLVMIEDRKKKKKKEENMSSTSYQNNFNKNHNKYHTPAVVEKALNKFGIYSPYNAHNDDVNNNYHYNYNNDDYQDEEDGNNNIDHNDDDYLYTEDGNNNNNIDPYYDEYVNPINTEPTNNVFEANMYNTYNQQQQGYQYENDSKNNKKKKKKKKNKNKKKSNNYVWGQSPFIMPQKNANINNNHNNNYNVNNDGGLPSLFNAFGGGGGSFGGFKLFGGNGGNGISQNEYKQQKENKIPRSNVKEEYEKAMKTGKTVRLRLIRRRQFVENDDGDAHFRRCESQFMRSNQRNIQYNMMMGGYGMNGGGMNGGGTDEINKTIQEVEYVINPGLISKFENKKKLLMNKYKYKDESELNIVLAWHGTKKKNINGIVLNNFDLQRLSVNSGDTGWYGGGIYFSEYASISRGYGDGLLLCKVILGKSYRMKTTQKQDGRGLENGYDSHLVVGNNNNQYGQEIVIFDVDQILPSYIIKY